MCGRFAFFTDKEIKEVEEIIEQIDKDVNKDKLKTGEIFPSNMVPVLLKEKQEVYPQLFSWGFPSFQGKQLIINARAETASKKPMFRSALETRRCVIPSTGFFEWDKDKNKYLFNIPDSDMLYMAGLFNQFEKEKRFVILTTDANISVAEIHKRMPVVLPKGKIKEWLFNDKIIDKILFGDHPILMKQLYKK
ncbi:MAG: SOS response-associated peptidase [Fermentimonas sp.]|nr:SOS response-associated peptidase [Fermentimonas sp.]